MLTPQKMISDLLALKAGISELTKLLSAKAAENNF
jgi:hypothetical protein